jgi:hypothetical protein
MEEVSNMSHGKGGAPKMKSGMKINYDEVWELAKSIQDSATSASTPYYTLSRSDPELST